MPTSSLHVLTDRPQLLEGPLGALLVLGADRTDGRLSVVEQTLAPRALGAPVHSHRREDEYSLVLEGTLGAEIDGELVEAPAGSVLLKPRGVPHAIWNARDTPARLLELIVPGGFERYFVELGEVFSRPGPPDLGALAAVAAAYEIEMDVASIPRLAAEHGLDIGAPPPHG